MTKLFFIFLTAILIASNVIADPKSSLGMEVRGDLVKNKSKDETETVKDDKNATLFQLNTAQLDFSTKANENMDVRVKVSFLNSFVPASDGLPPAVTYAYVNVKLTDRFSLRAGEQSMNAGGRENDYSGYDQYIYSYGNSFLPGPRAGVSVTGKINENNSLFFGLFNSDVNSGVQTNLGFGLTYYGNLMNSYFEPIISYHQHPKAQKVTVATSTVTKKDADDTFFNIGTRVNVIKTGYLEVELYKNTIGQQDITLSKDDEQTGIIFFAKDRIEKFAPSLKLIAETIKTNGVENFNRRSLALALEYYPYEKGDFRWHTAITNYNDDFKAATTKDSGHSTFLVGFSTGLTELL